MLLYKSLEHNACIKGKRSTFTAHLFRNSLEGSSRGWGIFHLRYKLDHSNPVIRHLLKPPKLHWCSFSNPKSMEGRVSNMWPSMRRIIPEHSTQIGFTVATPSLSNKTPSNLQHGFSLLLCNSLKTLSDHSSAPSHKEYHWRVYLLPELCKFVTTITIKH